jgi:uncharacterized membrane protein
MDMAEEAHVMKRNSKNKATVEVIVAIFEAELSAEEAMEDLKYGGENRGLKVVSAAVVTKDSDGKVKVQESHHLSWGHSLGWGAGAGLLLGLIPGAPIAGALVGAGLFAASATGLTKKDDPDKALLSHVADALGPATSAFVALVEPDVADALVTELSQFNARVIRKGLSEEVAAQVIADAEANAAATKAAKDVSDTPTPADTASGATVATESASRAAPQPATDDRLSRPLINNVGGVIDQDAPSIDQVHAEDNQSWSDTPVIKEGGHYGPPDPHDDRVMPSIADFLRP